MCGKNYLAHGTIKCLKKTGRRSLVSLWKLRILKRIIKKNRRECASEITAIWNKEMKVEHFVSTCSRQLKGMGYRVSKVG